MRSRLVMVATLLAVSGASASAARAGESRAAYQLSLDLDVPLLLIAGGVASSFLFMNETGPAACAPLCDRSDVNRIDRPFAGYYSKSWTQIGDVAMAATLLLVPAGLLLGEPSRGGIGDLLVVGEAVLVTSAIQVSAAYMVGRPRPRVYGDEAPVDERNDANAGRSFFSGHVANCVAATIVGATALRRIGRPRLAWTVLAVGLAGSALVGVARVASGGHFPSDVLVGYAVGTGVGIALPALHGASIRAAPLVLRAGGGLAFSGGF